MDSSAVKMSQQAFGVLYFAGISCFFPVLSAAPFPFDSNETRALLKELTTSYLFSDESTIHTHAEEHSSLHLAAWNYDYVAIPLDISLFILLTGVVKIIFHRVPHLSSYIPESCVLIVIGTIMGAILYFAAHVPDTFKLHSSTFMLYLLPPIVLEASYSLNDRSFSDNIGTILLYAVLGTIINFIIIGFSMYGLNTVGAIGLPPELSVTMLQFLLFASLIVAVDPVAVIVIFQDVGVHRALYFLVFGESLLNDAVTIVLNNMMQAFNDAGPEIDVDAILIGIGSFFTISLGALAVGIVVGIISSLLTRVTGHVKVIEPLMILLMAYLSYLCAELFHWSGIISMVGCGLVQAQYALHNISRNSHITVHYFIRMVSATCESVVFLFLGLELVRTNHVWNTGFVLWALFFCLVARVVSVFGLTFFVNLQSKSHKIKLEEQFIMWYGGLRGAIAFVLCSTINIEENVRNMFLTTTFFIILFTVFGQGITIKPLVKYCKILLQGDDTKDLLVELQNLVGDSLVSGFEQIVGQPGETNFHTWLYKMNDKYLKRWFQIHPLTDKEQFLDLYRQVSIQYYEAMINNGGVVPLIPLGSPMPINDFPFGLDVSNDKKEAEFASEIQSEIQAGKQNSSNIHLSRGDMYRILSKASLARSAWHHDRDLMHHDIADIPTVPLINDELVKSVLDVNSAFVTPFGSMQQLNVSDQTPFGSAGKLRQSPNFLTPTNSMLHLLTTKTPLSREADFQLKKAISVLSLSEAQERMIVPTITINSSVQRKLKKQRSSSKRSISVTEPPKILFVPARSRKNSTTYDPSKRLTTLGEEQTEEMTSAPDAKEFGIDQKEAEKREAHINKVMYDDNDMVSANDHSEIISQPNDYEKVGVNDAFDDDEDGDDEDPDNFTSL